MASKKLLTIWLLVFGLILNFDKTLMSLIVQVLQKDQGWSPADAGDLLSIVYVSFCLATIPSGWIVDRFHYRRYIRVSLLILAVGSLGFFLIASSSALLNVVWLFLVIRFITGLGYPGYTTGVPKVIQENFPHEQRGSVQGYVLSTIGVGAILSFTVGIAVIAHWRWLYAFLATGFFLLWCISAKLPQQAALLTQTSGTKISLWSAWKDGNTLILALIMIVIEMVCMAIMNWLPTLLNHKFGLETAEMTGLLLIYAVVMSIGIATVAKLRQKYFLGKEGTFIAVCAVLGAGLLFIFDQSGSLVVAIIAMYGANLLLTWSFGLIWVLPYDFCQPKILASSFAVINLGSFIGGIAQGTLIGRIVEMSGGFTAAILFMSATLLIVSALPRLLRKVADTAA